MNVLKSRPRYKLNDKIKTLISKDEMFMVSLANKIKTNTYGLSRMMDRDSQSLMHIYVLDFVSRKYNIPIKKLYQEI